MPGAVLSVFSCSGLTITCWIMKSPRPGMAASNMAVGRPYSKDGCGFFL